jgi:hypothetical protein
VKRSTRNAPGTRDRATAPKRIVRLASPNDIDIDDRPATAAEPATEGVAGLVGREVRARETPLEDFRWALRLKWPSAADPGTTEGKRAA